MNFTSHTLVQPKIQKFIHCDAFMQFWNSNPLNMIQLIEFESFVPAAFGPLLVVQVRSMWGTD
jgi:hypothetical protein